MSILSIQSSVAVGHVGNSASAFPLQRLGFDVWQVPSVLYSNHSGYDSHHGKALPVSMLKAMVDGMEKLDKFKECDAIFTGYLGRLDTARFSLETIERIKAVKPDTPYLCDPNLAMVHNKTILEGKLADFIREQLVPKADILIPNVSELEFLSGRRQRTLDDALFAADYLRAQGVKSLVITSVLGRKGNKATLSNIMISDGGAWRVTVPRLPLRARGCGATFCALYLAHTLRGETPKSALELATASLFGIIDATVRNDGDELYLITAQSELLNFSFFYDAVRVG